MQLFVREGDGRRCVVSLQSAHGLRWIVPEGAVLPLRVGSAGRILSGETGSDGWVQSVEEREPGVASVSAPVVDGHGDVVAASASADRWAGSAASPAGASAPTSSPPPPTSRRPSPGRSTRRWAGWTDELAALEDVYLAADNPRGGSGFRGERRPLGATAPPHRRRHRP